MITQIKTTKRYVLQRKSDGKYYQPLSYKKWTDDITKTKLYTSSGHPKNAVGIYVPYKKDVSEEIRATVRKNAFDRDYTILTVEVSFNV